MQKPGVYAVWWGLEVERVLPKGIELFAKR
jgi:hypothetical protein